MIKLLPTIILKAAATVLSTAIPTYLNSNLIPYPNL